MMVARIPQSTQAWFSPALLTIIWAALLCCGNALISTSPLTQIRTKTGLLPSGFSWLLPQTIQTSRCYARSDFFLTALQSSAGITNNPVTPFLDNSTPSQFLGDSEPVEYADCVVCGGGPAGLLTAIMLAQKLPVPTKIRVYDRLSAPPNPDDETVWGNVAKFYLLGLGGRGQAALHEHGVWESVVQDRCVNVVGRRDWQPGSTQPVERIFTKAEKRVTTQVLPRDKLVGCLHQHILEQYADRIELNYGFEVHPVDFNHQDGTAVLLQVAKCQDEIARLNPSLVKTATEKQEDILCSIDSATLLSAGFLVAADGTVRTVANAMERADQKRVQAMNPIRQLWYKPFRVKRYVDDNQRIYKSIPMKLPPDWRGDLNYSARGKAATFDALPADTKGNYCGVLLLKRDHPLARANTDPAELRQMLDTEFPYFSALISDDNVLAQIAQKDVSYLPGFRYAGPRLHQGNRCVILGDCAHTVKPYFGLGANSALEDVRILGRIIDEAKTKRQGLVRKTTAATTTAALDSADNSDTDWMNGVAAEFSRQRAADSRSLVRISRDLDRPGLVGAITFIIPIILDSIFSKYLPRLFLPNVISMLQREGWTFARVARRKRLDRVAQLTILASLVGGMAGAASWMVRKLATAVGVSPAVIVGGVVGTVATARGAAVWLQRRQQQTSVDGGRRLMFSNVAPADVLAKFDKRGRTGEDKKSTS